MTEVTKYVCDYCGEEFEDEEDCLAHEMRELKNSAINDIHIADKFGHSLILDDDALGRMMYVSIDTADAAEVINNMLDEAGYETISRETKRTIGKFYYDEDDDFWHSFEEIEEKYNKIAGIFEHLK